MEKVLIISYFFPPCNLTASQRAQSWANYLSKFGYKPVVITRRWDHKISHLSDVSKATPDAILHQENENYEVYYVPYHPNLRDQIYVKYRENGFNFLRRFLTMMELLFQPFFNAAIPYDNIGEFANDYLEKNPDVKKMVVSGNPFNLFKFGYQLHNSTGIKWIADYRDAWTTGQIQLIDKGFFHRFIHSLDAHYEKKWVGTARVVTASSQPIADEIGKLVKRKSHAIYNGFVLEDFKGIKVEGKFTDFTITYVGMLYPGQKVEIFLDAYKEFIRQTPDVKAKLLFPGIAFLADQHARIKNAMTGFEPYYECTERIERMAILEIEKRSHLLFHVAWDEHKGIIASKIYEYIASGSYIIVTPTDHGAIEEIVQKSGCGVCTETVEETVAFLKSEYENYLAGRIKVNDTSSANVLQFSREKQAGVLAELLNQLK